MDAALRTIRAAAGGQPARARAIARHIADENDRNPRLWARRRGPEDGIPNPPPPYTALPTEGEVTVDLSLPEPEYTPRYTLYAHGQKRKREEGDNLEEDGEEENNSN
ncbi:hypothetical protein N0V85_008873 [Neurospora sp. IMI 360204]|nr:hypothetical protein N0V85_008873 [Neurospora sp. IMI 360204]